MSAAAPVYCPKCNSVVFAVVYGMAEGVCCGQRLTAMRETVESKVKIVNVERKPKRFVAAAGLAR